MKAISPKLAEKCGNLWVNYWMKKDPRIMANRAFKAAFGRDIDWENPKNLIEKQYWLQLNTDTTLWTLCADKYRVREYVKDKGCGEILNELYGKWDAVCDVDYSSLPEKFVLKTNNGCGEVFVIKDKNNLDIQSTNRQLNAWMKEKYGYASVQLHYSRIKPCVIAEKLLEESGKCATLSSQSLIDYKIWCFNGKPECVLVVFDRVIGKESKQSIYDLEWNNISSKVFKPNVKYYEEDIPKPKHFDKMLDYARILSDGFPQVRTDFYYVDDKVVFGELTFTAGYGDLSDEYYEHLGEQIILPKLPQSNEVKIKQ